MEAITANQIFGILMLAFSLGLLHALDADHIMAVTAIAGKCPNIKSSLTFCWRWAVGHGLALMLISLLVLIFGRAIPFELSSLAEQLVGGVLIILGGWILFDMFLRRLNFNSRKSGIGCEAKPGYQQQNEPAQEVNHEHKHGATFVGMLHGTAGSSPLLALLPISKFASPWIGVAYVLLFGIGVFVAMLLVGGLLGRMFSLANNQGKQVIAIMRSLIAGCSIIYGAYLLNGVFR